MAEFNLEGYKPYLSLNWDNWDGNYREAHAYPEPSLTQEEWNTIAQAQENGTAYNEDGSWNEEVVGQEIMEKFAADEQASQEWETARQMAKEFALGTAIKSTHSQANTGMPIASMIPYGDALKLSWEFAGTLTPMLDNATYPDVSNVAPTVKAVEGENLYQLLIRDWQD